MKILKKNIIKYTNIMNNNNKNAIKNNNIFLINK